MPQILPKSQQNDDKYKDKFVRFLDKGDHYELVFTDTFDVPISDSPGANTVITDVVLDMKEANKDKELHIFVGSYGGAAHALNMIIQQIVQFKHRVGINLGYACSCGFMLLSYCEELYTTPYATFLYHEISTIMWSKIAEIKSELGFMDKWWKLLLEGSNCKRLLTKEELKLGETSEVWLTGQDLIDRGVAADYSYYMNRTAIQPDASSFYVIGDEVYRKEGKTFKKYIKDTSSKKKPLEYIDLVIKNHQLSTSSDKSAKSSQ